MNTVYSFEPIFDKNSKVLILGTVPSITSREKNFYYSHASNRFWKIFENLFNVKLNTVEEKINFLLKNNIALWGTIKKCDIEGSKDSSIRNVHVNDINSILKLTNIKTIYVTGKVALNIYNKQFYNKTNIEAIYLPCPSSANAFFNLEKLTEIYKIILNNLK